MNVLLLEDSQDLIDLYSKALSSQGWSVTAVTNVTEGFAEIENNEFDLVLSDIGLPGQSGIDFIKTVRESEKPGQRIKIAAVTAYDDLELDSKGSGFDAHIRKPVSAQQLVEFVRRVSAPPRLS